MANAVRLAVLINADNASASVIDELLQEVAEFGTASILDASTIFAPVRKLANHLRPED